jgi:3'-phosphoadenosine 5'-phosphosulfate sulfotransferase
MKEIRSRLGGPKGCTHVVELLNDAVRLTSMLLLGRSVGYQPEQRLTRPEEEIISAGKQKLRNTCLVFADD